MKLLVVLIQRALLNEYVYMPTFVYNIAVAQRDHINVCTKHTTNQLTDGAIHEQYHAAEHDLSELLLASDGNV